MNEEPKDIKTIFAEALEKNTPQDRAAYLDKACGGDADLRSKLESLLESHDQAGSFLDAPALDVTVTFDKSPLTEGPGTVIGPYKLLEKIGEGGMAYVYMAEQERPLRRRVALKIIKLGMDTKQVIARFEVERQALAVMDHPNIAKVFDAGATETGRPYFVMELVKGVSITEYCDKNKLNTKERLDLFIQVCNAVQHAHQKGIIHRDIKPSNVMVTLHDGKPVPKVIDFGIAKATIQRLTEKTLFTKYAQMIGTPEYMSPEQAEMSGLDIDTRADIYSLGVLLYELLTGTTPFDAEDLRSKGYGEMQRIIRETEPLKPSTKLSTMGDALTGVAEHRKTNPNLLAKLVRGDLDWIVMKTLEKDRTRRYETVSSLAADVKRHLNEEPVLAGPPSVRYRLSKFVRRNRVLVTGVSAVLVVLVAGVAVSTIFAVGQARARAMAEFHATMLHATMEYFYSGFFVRGADATVGEVVDTLSKDIELAEKLYGPPLEKSDRPPLSLMVTAAHQALGNMYTGLKMYEEAEPHLERAYQFFRKKLGQKHEATLYTMHDLGLLYLRQGRYDKGEPLLANVLEISRRVKGVQRDWMFDGMSALGREYSLHGRYNDAELLLVEALEISRRVSGEEHPTTLTAMTDLALLYGKEGRYDEADPLLVKAMETGRRVLGEEHPTTLTSMKDLAWLYGKEGRYAEAEPLLVKALEISRRVHGEEHDETLNSMNELGRQYFQQGRYSQAEPLLVRALETARRTLGEEHQSTLYSMYLLGFVYCEQGRYEEAEALTVKALEVRRRTLGEEHERTLWSMTTLGGWLYRKEGRYDEAEPLLVKALETSRRVLGEEHLLTTHAMHVLGVLYTKQGRYKEAEPLLVTSLESIRRMEGEENAYTPHHMDALGVLYTKQGRYDEAERLLVKAVEVRRRVLGEERPRVVESMNDLAVLYREQGRYNAAQPLFLKALEVRRRVLGEEHPDTLTSMADLALLYLKQARYDEAEPLATACYSGRSTKFGPEHSFTKDAIKIIIKLYEAWGKPEQAEQWRGKLPQKKDADEK